MSAYFVSEGTIRLLVEAAQQGPYPVTRDSWALAMLREARDEPQPPSGEPDPVPLFADDIDPATALGRVLWLENVRSLRARYDDPGYADEWAACEVEARAYVHRPAPMRAEPVQTLKAAACLRYQSCEHPGWETSPAAQLLERIERNAIHALPGYEDARWGAPPAWDLGYDTRDIATR